MNPQPEAICAQDTVDDPSAAVTILDYGMGNLRSVQKALEHIGQPAAISSDPALIAASNKIILPGVGAFRDAIEALRQHDLIDVIKKHIAEDKPFLGICLGLQLMLELSFEDGEFEGLGIVPGHVRRFDLPPNLKIPHMGWNQIQIVDVENPLLNGISDDAWFYFVHSYYVDPSDSAWIAATTDYGGPFVSMVRKGNTFATQFHPEKSQSAGLQLLRNFAAL